MDKVVFFAKEYNHYLVFLLIVCLIVGYLFGSIPVGYIYSKAHGVNILEFGSGNPGSTNVGRALGKKHGIKVFLLDILKIVFPVLLIHFAVYFLYYRNLSYGYIDFVLKFFSNYIAIYTGVGGVIGHNFPIFLKFKGGKGISCTMGAIFCFSVVYSLILFLIYKIITKITKYVSLGSIGAVTALLISSIILAVCNVFPYDYHDLYSNVGSIGVILLPGIFIMWALAIIRHKDNIIRLIKGTENKISE